MELKSTKQILAMTECSVMVALSTVLSLIKIIEMPYGGSVTVASMLPIVIAVYRHGALWGIGAALANSVIQLLLGLNNLSYFTTWQSIVAIIVLDYVVAFGVFALAGIFKKIEKRQNYALLYGVILSSVLRYACHVISGATVWAGLSIPTEAALVYSISYNATYMLPETIVLASVTAYLTSVMDFKSKTPTRIKSSNMNPGEVYATLGAGLLLILTVILDVCLVFPHLQDPDSGEFVFKHLSNVNFILVAIISAVGIISASALLIYKKVKSQKTK